MEPFNFVEHPLTKQSISFLIYEHAERTDGLFWLDAEEKEIKISISARETKCLRPVCLLDH